MSEGTRADYLALVARSNAVISQCEEDIASHRQRIDDAADALSSEDLAFFAAEERARLVEICEISDNPIMRSFAQEWLRLMQPVDPAHIGTPLRIRLPNNYTAMKSTQKDTNAQR